MSQARSLTTAAALVAFLALFWKELPAMRRYLNIERM